MKQIHKKYTSPFMLEPTKLTRLVEKMHERLGEHQHVKIQNHFEAFLSGDRNEDMTNIDELLAMENSRKRRIERVVVTCSAINADSARMEHEIQIDLASTKSSQLSKTQVIAVSVRSDSAGWASRAFSDIEEQVERTRLPHFQPVAILVGLLVLVLVFFVVQFVTISFSTDLQRVGWLTSPDLDHVEEILGNDKTITEADLRDIASRQLRNILQYQRPHAAVPQRGSRQLVLVAVPVAIVFCCGVYLLATCYPSAIFLWGDEVDRFAGLAKKRTVLWSIIIGVLITGVASKLLLAGVLPPVS